MPGHKISGTILLQHVREGERLFGDNPWTYTRCQEVLNGYPILVGGGLRGGHVSQLRSDYSYPGIGVSCCRQF
jgi:hypothetical protein